MLDSVITSTSPSKDVAVYIYIYMLDSVITSTSPSKDVAVCIYIYVRLCDY